MTQTTLPATVRIDAHGVTLAFDLACGHARPVYLGPALAAGEDIASLANATARGPHESQADAPVPPSLLPQDGWGALGTPAVQIGRAGVLLPTRFVLDRAEADDGQLHLGYADAHHGLSLVQDWRIGAGGIVTACATLENRSVDTVDVLMLASLALPLPGWASRLGRFSGRWSGEMQETVLPIVPGIIAAESRGGRPGFGGGQWALVTDEGATASRGRVLAAHLAWSGDHRLQVERSADGDAVLMLAARLDAGEVRLAPGARYRTPDALFCVSHAGRDGAAQAMHHHVLREIVPSAARTPRKVHLNSWEALGFDMSLLRLMRLADDAAAIGIERFVLDDGWFTGRRNDRTSLGDWTADAGLFPDGLGPLIAHVTALGMDFGLWVEPEMISPDSALYRAHPDWCIHLPGALRLTQRHQLMLDLTIAAASDHVFNRLDALLRAHPIAYLKWDHNRDMFPRSGKGVAQVEALYALLDRLRAAHPAVEIETCASGGGRVDMAILRRCTRIWASDNNDAVERLRINRGWFQFLPPAITGNHVGPSPNPITGRRLSMDFRAKVAMFGHMGVEADPAAMTPGERETLAAHIALYKVWRGVIHGGRLSAVACEDPGVTGWLAFDGARGLALVAQTAHSAAYDAPLVCLPGLPADARFRVTLPDPWPRRAAGRLAAPDRWREGLILSGRALADVGLALSLSRPETAWLIAIEKLS